MSNLNIHSSTRACNVKINKYASLSFFFFWCFAESQRIYIKGKRKGDARMETKGPAQRTQNRGGAKR